MGRIRQEVRGEPAAEALPLAAIVWWAVFAGIPPIDILRFATQASAETVGLATSWGTLEVGKIADIVLLDANPLEDIKNTQAIWRVIKGGGCVRSRGVEAAFS